MVGAIKGSTKREPTVVGKPSGFMLDNIATKFNIRKDQICMVGDRLDTDVLFGKQVRRRKTCFYKRQSRVVALFIRKKLCTRTSLITSDLFILVLHVFPSASSARRTARARCWS